MSMGIVYILQSSASGKYYIGSTNDIDRRISQHKHGHTLSTKRLGDFKLVFHQEFPSLIIARKVERKIKKWKRRDYIDRIVQEGQIKITGCGTVG